MSQLNELAAMIVAAIDRVNTSIQKTQTYIDANTISIGGGSISDSAGVSGSISMLGVLYLIYGDDTGASGGASGVLDVVPGLGSEAVEVSAVGNVSGDLDILTELGSSIVEISGAGGTLGDLDVATELQGLVEASSEVSAVRLNAVLLAGESDGGGGIAGDLDVLTELVGDTIAEGSITGGSLYVVL